MLSTKPNVSKNGSAIDNSPIPPRPVAAKPVLEAPAVPAPPVAPSVPYTPIIQPLQNTFVPGPASWSVIANGPPLSNAPDITGTIPPLVTYQSQNVPFYGRDGAGGGPDGVFSSIVVAGTTSTSILECQDGLFSTFSTPIADINDLNTSTIFAYEVFIDNQGLTANATELLLNGIPVATTANLSSIQDWAIYPAVSTIDCAKERILNAGPADVESLVVRKAMSVATDYNNTDMLLFASTPGFITTGQILVDGAFTEDLVGAVVNQQMITQLRPGSYVASLADGGGFGQAGYALLSTGQFSTAKAEISSLVCNDISTITFTAVSTIHAISSISSSVVSAEDGMFSSINGGIPYTTANPPPPSTLGNEITISSIRGNQTLDLTSDQGASLNIPKINMTAKNGLGGNITLTADTGAGGTSFGAVNLIANGGITEGVGTGGSITIQANTPVGTLSNASSKVTIDAAGVNIYAGAVAPVGSLTGYLFQYGTLGINECVGLPSVLPNFPGTHYTYATGGVGYGGIRMESPAGVEMVNSTDFYPYRIYPYYNTFLVGTHPDLTITGRSNVVGNNQYLMLSSVKGLEFGFNESNGEIKGLSSINGQPLSFYEPGGVSTVSSFTSLYTQNLDVSTISFPTGLGGISGDDAFTTIQGINNIVAKNVEFSTIQGEGGGNLQITTPATAPLLNASSINLSTAVVQGQIIIEPSTLRSGVYMPFDATNGTGVVAVGLSTSASIYEKYAALLALSALPIGGVAKEMPAFLQTDNNELSFEYADLQVGRLLVGGNYSYSLNPTAYLDGDQVGNLTAAALSFNTSNAVVSSLKLSPSSILYSQSTDAEIVCGTASDPADYSQIAASALRLASSSTASNGVVVYGEAANRLQFVDGLAATKTLAYTNDSNVSLSSINNVSSLSFAGISTITFATSATAGANGQTAGRLVMSGCDLDLGQNDIWVQQVRVGAGNPGGSAQTEIVFYDPTAATQRGFNLGNLDRTIRIVSTINAGVGGYLLDTTINPPFFSTINSGTSTALMSFFPSTNTSTIGVSTISIMPPNNYFCSVYSSTSQLVAGANVSTIAQYNTTSINVGGFTIGTSTIGVPVAGIYEITASFQFATTSGGTNLAEFWLVKNGNAVDQTNSRVSIVNNGDTLGNISIMDTAAAGDKYGWMFYSADANMSATAVAAGATPGIPSIIASAKRLS